MDKAPIHLKPHSAAWFDGVMSVFELAPHHVHLLTLACDALDRGAQAREALSTNGITYIAVSYTHLTLPTIYSV